VPLARRPRHYFNEHLHSICIAPICHFERYARNLEAAMLQANITCSGPSIGISFGVAQDKLSRGSHARE
jgi:hypothetical protein